MRSKLSPFMTLLDLILFIVAFFEPGVGIESPSDDPPGQQEQEEPGSLRDKMLKPPDTENYQVGLII